MTKRFTRRMTAAELMASLQSDPEWVRQDAEREARHNEAVARFQAEIEPEHTPLLAELAKAGFILESIWDLVNTSRSYPAAIPILSHYLTVTKHSSLRDGIARALTVREARGAAARVILDELKRQFDPHGSEARWTLANALTVAADASLADELLALYEDPAYDDVHERLRKTLRRLRRKV
jgi:hypothetical protein